MPYIIAPIIRVSDQGLWAEGNPYERQSIYDICSPSIDSPPVNYDSHKIKPHSICHFDAPSHITPSAETIDQMIARNLGIFHGPVNVLQFEKTNFLPHKKNSNVFHWEISIDELKSEMEALGESFSGKVFISFKGADEHFYKSNTHAMTLSIEAVNWLLGNSEFNLFGTIWKSTDYQIGSRERPIHKAIFKKGGILECLNLSAVPAGKYFLSAVPLLLEGASESPVTPVLFSRDELVF